MTRRLSVLAALLALAAFNALAAYPERPIKLISRSIWAKRS
jgi:hypothetical protein